MHGFSFRTVGRHQRICVAGYRPILQRYDASGIFLGKLAVMGDQHHEPVTGDLLEYLHYLYAVFTVQRACGLVSQQNNRVIHQRPGNSHALHLTA